MPLVSDNQYAGGIHFATPAFSMGLYDGSAPNGGLTFDLPLATVAAFNNQALDFSSTSSANRFGFFNNVADKVQAANDKTNAAVLGQMQQGTTLLDKINDTFFGVFNPKKTGVDSGSLLGSLPAVPSMVPTPAPAAAGQSLWDKFINGGSNTPAAIPPAASPSPFMYTLTALGSSMNAGATQVAAAPPSDFLALYGMNSNGDFGA